MPAFVGTRRALLGGGSAAFVPTQISGLKLWLKADAGLTLSTTGYAGTGTVTQVGTAVTGIGTLFLSEVVIGDALSGALISGTVTAIADNTHLTVNASNSGAGAAYTITPAAGATDRVTTWADQSGTGNNVTQATASIKPFEVVSDQNGLPGVRFLAAHLMALASSPFTGLAQPSTLFVVGKVTADSANAQVFLTGLSGHQNAVYYIGVGNKIDAFAGTNLPSAGAASSAVRVYTGVFNGASSAIGTNGVETAGDAGTQDITGYTVGSGIGASFLNGDLFELIFYNALLTVPQRAQVVSYLNTKWAVF